MSHAVLYVTSDLKYMTRLVIVHLDEDSMMISGKAGIRNSIDIVRHDFTILRLTRSICGDLVWNGLELVFPYLLWLDIYALNRMPQQALLLFLSLILTTSCILSAMEVKQMQWETHVQ